MTKRRKSNRAIATFAFATLEEANAEADIAIRNASEATAQIGKVLDDALASVPDHYPPMPGNNMNTAVALKRALDAALQSLGTEDD